MITLRLTPEDVVNTRFAFSPMWEVMMSYRVLLDPSQHTLYLDWVCEARRALAEVDVTYLDALLLPSGYLPDFLTPPPVTPMPDFKEELAAMRETPPEIVRRDVRKIQDRRSDRAAVLEEYQERPVETLGRLAETIQVYWDGVLAHHWPKIQAVLEGDVLYRSRRLALLGAEALFSELHSLVRYETQADRNIRLEIFKSYDYEAAPAGEGMTLVPVLFSWPKLYALVEHPAGPALCYSPRGAGLWNSQVRAPSEALERALGGARANTLQALEVPTATGELARKLDRTPGAVSQQLSRLRQAGLVEPLRQGRYVFYRRTMRGDDLLALFEPA